MKADAPPARHAGRRGATQRATIQHPGVGDRDLAFDDEPRRGLCDVGDRGVGGDHEAAVGGVQRAVRRQSPTGQRGGDLAAGWGRQGQRDIGERQADLGRLERRARPLGRDAARDAAGAKRREGRGAIGDVEAGGEFAAAVRREGQGAAEAAWRGLDRDLGLGTDAAPVDEFGGAVGGDGDGAEGRSHLDPCLAQGDRADRHGAGRAAAPAQSVEGTEGQSVRADRRVERQPAYDDLPHSPVDEVVGDVAQDDPRGRKIAAYAQPGNHRLVPADPFDGERGVVDAGVVEDGKNTALDQAGKRQDEPGGGKRRER